MQTPSKIRELLETNRKLRKRSNGSQSRTLKSLILHIKKVEKHENEVQNARHHSKVIRK